MTTRTMKNNNWQGEEIRFDPASNRLVEEIRNLAIRFSNWTKALEQRRIDRIAFRQMMMMDNRSLKDIGITRGDIVWANSLPIHQTASLELGKVARAKSPLRKIANEQQQ